MAYKYKKQNGIISDPIHFVICYDTKIEPQGFTKVKFDDLPMIQKVIGEFTESELRSITEHAGSTIYALEYFRGDVCKRMEQDFLIKVNSNEAPLTKVTVDTAGNVTCREIPAITFHSIEKLPSGQIRVLVNASLDNAFYWPYSPSTEDVELEEQNGSWRICSSPAVTLLSKPRDAEEQTFLFWGKLDNKKLAEAVDVCRGILGLSVISVAAVDDEGNIGITSGQKKGDLVFGNIALSQPRALLRLEKVGSSWKTVAIALIERSGVYPDLLDANGISIRRILFFDKPSETEIERLKKEVEYFDDWLDLLEESSAKMKKMLSEDDVEQIAEIVLRTRGLMGRSRFMLDVSRPDYVGAITMPGDFVQVLDLKKVNGKWIIDWTY